MNSIQPILKLQELFLLYFLCTRPNRLKIELIDSFQLTFSLVPRSLDPALAFIDVALVKVKTLISA